MVQQIIDIGTVANDRTGDTFRDGFDKANDNFTEVYGFIDEFAAALDNVVVVNELSDLPTPDGGGFIEIGGGITTYLFSASGVDLDGNTLRITGGVVVLKGGNRFTSGITSSSTNPLITIRSAFYSDEFMNFTNPNGPIFDYDADGLVQAAFVSQNVVIRSCTTIGSITDANTISMRTPTLVASSVGGLSVFGTDLFQFNISIMLGFSWTGNLIDLGTSTWDIINFGANNRWISPGGATIISGATGSANLTTNGRALVEGNIFNGTGTALAGVTTQDLKWTFIGNIFVDGTTQNTRVAVNSFLDGTSQTVTITTQSVYVQMDQNGTDWDTNKELRFTQAADGAVTYTGLNNIDVYAQSFSTVEKVGGGADTICTKIAIDTGSGFVVQDETIGCTENASATQVTSAGFFTLSTGDIVAVFCANLDSTSNITAAQATLLINEIM